MRNECFKKCHETLYNFLYTYCKCTFQCLSCIYLKISGTLQSLLSVHILLCGSFSKNRKNRIFQDFFQILVILNRGMRYTCYFISYIVYIYCNALHTCGSKMLRNMNSSDSNIYCWVSQVIKTLLFISFLQ